MLLMFKHQLLLHLIDGSYLYTFIAKDQVKILAKSKKNQVVYWSSESKIYGISTQT